MYQEHDVFLLTKSIQNNKDIPVGSLGVVLMVYDGNPPCYEVEFLDEDGINLGDQLTFTITEDSMKKLGPPGEHSAN